MFTANRVGMGVSSLSNRSMPLLHFAGVKELLSFKQLLMSLFLKYIFQLSDHLICIAILHLLLQVRSQESWSLLVGNGYQLHYQCNS